MLKRRSLTTALAAVISVTLLSAPAFADPGNGNGNGKHGNNGHHSGRDDRGNNGHGKGKADKQHGKRKNYGKPVNVDADISFSHARSLAVNYGLVGYPSLPPGIAKNLARGKPLPPGIAKKTLPAALIDDLPYYPGYEWRAVGDDLVLIALSTALVTAVINGVFD